MGYVSNRSKKERLERLDNSEKQALQKLLDPVWRLTHLYNIRTKAAGYEGQTVTFYPNYAQRHIYQALDSGKKRIIILKPRKLGTTTALVLYLLDKCMYSKNQVCRTIAHRKQTVGELFTDIAIFAFNRIKPELKPQSKHESKNELDFPQIGSRYSIDVEARGLTPSYLHFSEVAYVDDEYKLQDTLESLPMTAVGIAESTANGKGNWFERTFSANWQKLQEGKEPEWYPMFFAWFNDPENKLSWTEQTVFYFPNEVREMKAKFPHLNNHQLLWWDRKRFNLGERMPELYPSTPEEAFIFSTGKVYPEFSEGIHVLPRMSFDTFRVALDYGQTNPTAILLIHQTQDGDFIVFDEFYRRESHPQETSKWLKERGIKTVHYPDPSTFNKTQIPSTLSPGQTNDYRFSIADEFSRHGITFARGAQNDIPTGLVRVKEYLRFDPHKTHPYKRDEEGKPQKGSPRLFVTQNCEALRREFGLYRWPETPGGTLNRAEYETPIKENDHALDALRYALLTWGKPLSVLEEENVDPRTPKGILQRWKSFQKKKEVGPAY